MKRDVVGVRELKEQASEIIRRVREEGVSYEISYRGEVVATIVPTLRPLATREERMAAIRRGNAFARRMAEQYPDVGIDAAEVVRRDRDREPW